ncbi:hypothetical protein [Mycobacterium leprae]|nr:hypothetical protein [Mycobacterium leprae]
MPAMMPGSFWLLRRYGLHAQWLLWDDPELGSERGPGSLAGYLRLR